MIFLTEFETFKIARLYSPDSRLSLIVIRYLFIIIILSLSICSLAFSIIKFIFIIHNLTISKLYLSTVYLFLIFSSIEFLGIIIYLPSIFRIKLLQQQRSASNKKKVDLKRLFSLAKTERLNISLGTVFLLISSGTQIVQTYYFGKIVDDALTSDTMRLVNINVLIIFAVNCVGAVASFFRSWLFELSGQ